MYAYRWRGWSTVARTAAVLCATAAGTAQTHSPRGGTVVPVYRAWTTHDPAVAARTAAALAAHDAQCGWQTGPFELLRPDTPRQAAQNLVAQIEGAGVAAMAERALARASAALPGDPVTVCLYAAELSRGLPYLGGVGGISLGNGRIKLLLHPTKERFAKVPYTVAHEYHHEVHRAIAPGGTPDDVLVREGLADQFAGRLFPELRPPHASRLTDAEFAVAWPAWLEFRRGALSQAEFMIAPRGPLPMWAGYRLAFEIVDHYAQSTKVETARLLHVPSASIIESFARSPRVTALKARRP